MKLKQWLQSNILYTAFFCGAALIGFLLWLLILLMEGSDSNQYSLFFAGCGNLFADTTNVVGYSSTINPYNNLINGLGEKAYPPLTYVVMHLVANLIDKEVYGVTLPYIDMYKEPRFVIVFVIFTVLGVIFLYELIAHYKKGNRKVKALVSLSIVVSTPFLFTIERANSILFTVGLCLFFIFNYDNKNKYMKELALIALAIAAAIKMTPAILGVLLLYNKQWKDAIRTVIYGLLAFIVPFFFLHGGLKNIEFLIRNMKVHFMGYTPYDGCTLLASFYYYTGIGGELPEIIMTYFTNLSCIVFALGFPLYKRKWEKILVVLLVIIILPAHSGYYNVLYLIPAMIMFLNEKKHRISDVWILIAFMVVMCPLQTEIGRACLNYHFSLPLIDLVMVIRGMSNIIQYIKTRYGGHDNEQSNQKTLESNS